MQKALFVQSNNSKSVTCQLCNHFCVIPKGKSGLCQTRVNSNGTLEALNYGYPVALNIDPIEKKPLYHFMPGSRTFSLGTLGCNFACSNCQNWDISQAKSLQAKIKDLDYYRPERIIEETVGNDCESISFTYNEPTIFSEYALDIMKLAHQHDIKNVWVSNGYMSEECLEAIIPYLDAINVDLKSFSQDFYSNNCNARLQPILDNLIKLKQEQVHLEITTLIIPGYTDDLDTFSQIADYIVNELDGDTPWHLSRFSSSLSWKLKDSPSTPDHIIYEAHEIGKEAGLKYVYVGNVPGDQKENTYCPRCGELAIRRMGYQIERLDNQGLCSNCDRSLDIIE